VGLLYIGKLNIRFTFAHQQTRAAWIVLSAYYRSYWVFSMALPHLVVDGLAIDAPDAGQLRHAALDWHRFARARR
jgi:hypothetical protein